MGGMVMGLVIQTSATDRGRFTRVTMAIRAASSIWDGTGIKAEKRPTKAAPETERRLKCQSSERLSQRATGRRALISRKLSRLGINLRHRSFMMLF